MTHLIGRFQMERGKHRLHNTVFLFAVMTASIQTALVRKFLPQTPEPSFIGFLANQNDCVVKVQLEGIIDTVVKNETSDLVELELETQPRGQVPATEWPIAKVLVMQIAPLFVEFYERHKQSVEKAVGKDFIQWATVWQFARLVRHAASHGGAVSIDAPKFNPVTWSSVTYGPKQNGHRILGTDLTEADILILMLEMDEELDRLRCPI